MNQDLYSQYSDVLSSGSLSLNALQRIIRHDACSGWNNTIDGLTRIRVYEDCMNGNLPFKKTEDDPGDALYGVSSPLPLIFPQYVKSIKPVKSKKSCSIPILVTIGIVILILVVTTVMVSRL
jgi:hypothetical protein